MRAADPVDVLGRLPGERSHLLTLLDGLSVDEWSAPSPCPGWTVEHLALHLLGDDLGILSRQRDKHSLQPIPSDDLVTFVNRLNDTWIRAARRLSPRVLCELLDWGGEQTLAYFSSLDPLEPGVQVSWAGAGPAPNWLGIAREYTERWVHQQQIRESIEAPGLFDPRLFGPVLATFVRALPHTFHSVITPVGTSVTLWVDGDAGGRWAVVRSVAGHWELYQEAQITTATASVRMDQDVAWRMFTKAIDPATLRRRATLRGDPSLAETVLRAVAIIA